jgi:hypothetical protein
MRCNCCASECKPRYIGFDTKVERLIEDSSGKCDKCMWNQVFYAHEPELQNSGYQFIYGFFLNFFIFGFVVGPILLLIDYQLDIGVNPYTNQVFFIFVFLLTWLITSFRLINKNSEKLKRNYADTILEQIKHKDEQAIKQQELYLIQKDKLKNQETNTKPEDVPIPLETVKPPQIIMKPDNPPPFKYSPSPDQVAVNYNDESRIHQLGYKITGLTRMRRWEILQKKVIPQVPLQDIVFTIAGHIKSRKSQVNGEVKFAHAIAEWSHDLNRLKKEYYKNDFKWPRG